MLEKTEGAIKNRQSRDIGNIMHTRLRKKTSKTQHNTTQKTKNMRNTDPIKGSRRISCSCLLYDTRHILDTLGVKSVHC